ncbi:MAG: type II secretion system protein [Candidatus Gastranaerophilaceae bacterium]
MKNKAFTLAEVLIMMIVVGIIGTITMESISGLKPDKTAMMLRKAYSTTLSVVSMLANDEELYPSVVSTAFRYIETLSTLSATTTNTTKPQYSYNDSFIDSTDELISAPSVSSGGVSAKTSTSSNGVSTVSRDETFLDTTVYGSATGYTSTDKFAYNFASKMAKKGSMTKKETNAYTFKTPDGIYWEVTDNFSDTSKKNAVITVDLNGNSKGPNKTYASSKQPDIFNFYVDASGAVSIDNNDTIAKKYLSTRDTK